MEIIITLILLIGNLFLFGLFTGDSDICDNEISVLFIIGAVIMDIIMIGMGISDAEKKIKVIKQKRMESAKKQIDEIVQKYKPINEKIELQTISTKTPLTDEIISAIELLKVKTEKYAENNREIKAILFDENFPDDCSKLKFLKTKSGDLERLNEECKSLLEETSNDKVKIKKAIENERKRIESITMQIRDIIQRYTPTEKNVYLPIPTSLSMERKYNNSEIIDTVNELRSLVNYRNERYIELTNKIKIIIYNKDFTNDEDRLNYLKSKSYELESLCNECELIEQEISSYRIKLINEDTNLINQVKEAFTKLYNSKEIIVTGADLKNFICNKAPKELKYFKFDVSPVILYFGRFYYCLFSNVILIFDDSGIFSSAVDPSAFSLTVERHQKTITVTNNKFPSYENNVSVDSKCINQGDIRRTWRHTCRDGTPDLRYRGNYRIEFRNDTYEYGEISFSINVEKILMSISSNAAIEAFENLIPVYFVKRNNEDNRVSELLRLLGTVSEETKTETENMLRIYNKRIEKKRKFCEIIYKA